MFAIQDSLNPVFRKAKGAAQLVGQFGQHGRTIDCLHDARTSQQQTW
jgi:hypothetical protein